MDATEDFSTTGQYRAVTCTSDHGADGLDASSDLVVGILQNNPPSGGAAQVAFAGVTKAEAGAAITAGVQVVADSVGRVVPAGTGSAGTQVIGIALLGASAAGELVSVLLQPA